MSLTDTDRSLIYDMSLQLLQQDILTRTLFQGGIVGQMLRNMMVEQSSSYQRTNPYDEAITGTLRSDAAAVKQNSRNVSEASSMMGVAKEGVAGIQTSLADMKQILDDINSGLLSGSDPIVQQNYLNLKNQILGYVSNTEYNGIYMLDSSKWGTEQIDSGGNVYIQAFKNGGFDVNFYDASSLDFASLDETALGNQSGRDAQNALLDSLSSSIDSMHDMYDKRETSYATQATQLDAQSSLLTQAAETRRQKPAQSLESLLLDWVAQTTGSLLNTSS
ncbi:conserved hypothetical protein [Solidesulfovibrio fructosivorans JJ]]|uniref:Flagellin domain protein n=1 Tax=Solidesulfovibrio fructosivorans JJ] TaxID=596151 RepID=E1JTP8_SOLFR|nr:hypothetical protein [Solidesulfovibrio fructosivorans]EFL52177.1 conserved hypothetical protein [Solidesulfovibrio fructosivorans JJ]]